MAFLKKCAECGKEIKGPRRHLAAFCSTRCRVASHRRAKATLTIPGMDEAAPIHHRPGRNGKTPK